MAAHDQDILFKSTEKILSKLGFYASHQIRFACGTVTPTKDLKKLENTIFIVRNVLFDAQEQHANNLASRQWLQRVQDIVHDIDDLVDEFATESLRSHVVMNHNNRRSMIMIRREVCNLFKCFKFHYGIHHKMKDIRDRLDEIIADMRGFEFTIKLLDRHVSISTSTSATTTGSWGEMCSMDHVVGRENDKEAIIQSLILCPTSDDHEDDRNIVHILPIVGIGGLGKTTLAQLVYNDNRISCQFDQRLWVCVSDNFNIKRIIVKIVEVATFNDCENLTMVELQSRLRRVFEYTKFLLVLDDVWNEDVVEMEWIKLRDLLCTFGAIVGSRILVTTRSKTVASIMGTLPSYDLKALSDDDCLSVLVKWAFKDGDEKHHPDLVQIGREIVRKCGGAPLSARTLGGLLYFKTERGDWLSVRDNEIWAQKENENILTPALVLKLSYDHLPSHLKECFAYCSLFLKDEKINKWSLIYLWMAQGFIQSSHHEHNEELEEIGEGYFNEFMRRSFLEKVVSSEETYKVHDLVHDLAQFVAAGREYYLSTHVINYSNTALASDQRVRHLSSSLLTFPKRLQEVNKLRTFKELPTSSSSSSLSLQALISGFKHLRVLDLRNLHFELPNSVGDLKHLRYFRVMHLNKATLPKSFGRLLNLQYLDLNYCPNLHEFPKDFGNLMNLRYLRLSRLRKLPADGMIGGLTSLRTLSILKIYNMTSLPEEIRHLSCLRNLYIYRCPTLVSLPFGLRYLTALERLDIQHCNTLGFSDDDFRGLTSLKFLNLSWLPGLVSLPKGLQDTAATLTHIAIWFCGNLTALPESLANLTQLQSLGIYGCPQLLFLPEGMHRLIALRFLGIELCPYLTERCKSEKGEDWLKISHVPQIYINNSEHIRWKEGPTSYHISLNFISRSGALEEYKQNENDGS